MLSVGTIAQNLAGSVVNSRSNPLPCYTPENPFRLEKLENPWSTHSWRMIRSAMKVTNGPDITDDMLQECVDLFNSSFGVWSGVAEQFNWKARKGSQVKTTIGGLRRQCMGCVPACTLARHFIEGKLVGYAFVTRWSYEMKGNVCWVTQLVVERNYRGLGIAAKLLDTLKTDSDALFGIISSHPAAIMALSRVALDSSIASVDLELIREHLPQVLQASNIDYFKASKLHGSLFMASAPRSKEVVDSSDEDENGIISCVDTEFFMDHGEALQALEYLQNEKKTAWPLGELWEGVEFVLLVENKDHVVAVKD